MPYGQMPMGAGYPPFSAGQGAMAPPQGAPGANYGTRSSGSPSGYGSDGQGSGPPYGSRSRGTGSTPTAPRSGEPYSGTDRLRSNELAPLCGPGMSRLMYDFHMFQACRPWLQRWSTAAQQYDGKQYMCPRMMSSNCPCLAMFA